MKPSLISIITPTLNSEHTILDCISSVRLQNNVDIEHIIVDGGSSDNTLNLVENSGYEIEVLTDIGGNIYSALNKGVLTARGNIIAILNSDDKFTNHDVLSWILKILSGKSKSVVYAGIRYVDKKNTEVSYWLPSKFFRGAYSKGWHTPHPGFFATKDCYTEIAKFDESMKIAADFDLMARLMENKNVSSFHMEKIVVDMRIGGLSSTLKGRLLGFVEIYKSLKKQKLVFNTVQYFYFRYLNKILKRF